MKILIYSRQFKGDKGKTGEIQIKSEIKYGGSMWGSKKIRVLIKTHLAIIYHYKASFTA